MACIRSSRAHSPSTTRRQTIFGSVLLGITGATRAAFAEDALAVMEHDPQFTTWVRLINAAGLEGYPRGAAGAFTVFAPVEASFAHIPQSSLQPLLPHAVDRGADTSQTVYVVRSHVVAGLHEADEFKWRATTLTSVNGFPIMLDATGLDPARLKFQTSSGYISGAPLQANNAIIYPVTLTEVHYEQH